MDPRAAAQLKSLLPSFPDLFSSAVVGTCTSKLGARVGPLSTNLVWEQGHRYKGPRPQDLRLRKGIYRLERWLNS